MQTQNLFIIDDNTFASRRLVNFLKKKFSDSLTISTFLDGESVLKKVDSNTEIVILDYDLKGEKATALLLEIKKINPKTEVIILSSDEDIASAIDAFKKGAKNYIIKGDKAPRQLFALIYKIVNYPVKVLVERFGINKILAIFILYSMIIGIIVYFGMYFLPSNP